MNFKDIIENLKKDKKKAIVLFTGLIGIVLLLISNYSSDKNINSINSDVVCENNSHVMTIEDVEKVIEKKLTELISSVKGAGNTRVAVSVSSAGEFIYAENKKSDTDTDSASLDTEIVVFEQNDSENGLVISVKSPDVLGVAVICEGGDSSVVKAEITDLITSLFGIGSDRVYVGTKS